MYPWNRIENFGNFALKILGIFVSLHPNCCIIYEIKLGGDDLIKEGAESLLTLRNKIVEKSDEKAPSFLLVLTAIGGAYQREDGVYVAPINLLKP